MYGPSSTSRHRLDRRVAGLSIILSSSIAQYFLPSSAVLWLFDELLGFPLSELRLCPTWIQLLVALNEMLLAELV